MKTRTFLLSALILFVVLLGVNRAAAWFGIVVNHSGSMPVGLWLARPVDRPIVRGDTVGFCPPDIEALRTARARAYLGRGNCPGEHEHMLKPVVAVAGDVVTVADDGLYVNGEVIPGSAPLTADSKNRPLPRIRQSFSLARDELWMYSGYAPKSFDSRYYGPITAAQVTHFATPLLTWK